LKILSDPQLPSDVEVHARVMHPGEVPSGNENSLVIEVPVNALDSRNDVNMNLYSLHASFLAQIKNKNGEVIERFGEDMPRRGSLNTKDAKPGVVAMQRHFTAEPGDYVLEAVVVDQNSGKAGAQRMEFRIPALSDGQSLSDLALVQRVDPISAESDPEEPLRYRNGKVVAAASERVAQGTKELSFFFFVHPDSASPEAPKLEMEVLRNGESIAQAPLALSKTDGPVAIPYMTALQAGRLSPGEYQIVERLSQGGKTSQRTLDFRKGLNRRRSNWRATPRTTRQRTMRR
jgi:hypothetical protein